KPDLCAPNGVNTTVDLGGQDIEGDNLPNFFGTSAAAPHVAGAAALLIESRRTFYNENPTPLAIKNFLIAGSLDMGDAGFDFKSGNGLMRLDETLLSFATPAPQISSIDVPNGVEPGTAPFTLNVNGEFFTSESKLLFRGNPLTTAYISASEISAEIPAYTIGNPSLAVANAPTSPSNLDGGTSEEIFFSDQPKTSITISADNASRKYGEDNPAFSFSVSGLPANVTLAEAGLDNLDISLSTIADESSKAGLAFAITPFFNSLDPGLEELYEFELEAGLLTIEKMPLLIRPNEQNIDYGDPLAEVSFTYEYDNSNDP
ncbi:MAG: MBG domain-containing protein, partial [Bacteroidota bacterium]